MTQPSYSSRPTVDKNIIVSTTHSFRQADISINKDTRLGELMEYNANRITAATIENIAEKLAETWIKAHKAEVIESISIDDVKKMVMDDLQTRINERY